MVSGHLITTKFHGPTATKGARVSAEMEMGPELFGKPARATVSCHAVDGDADEAAARLVLAKVGWTVSHDLIGVATTRERRAYLVVRR